MFIFTYSQHIYEAAFLPHCQVLKAVQGIWHEAKIGHAAVVCTGPIHSQFSEQDLSGVQAF